VKLAPVTWDFLDIALSARTHQKIGAGKGRDEEALSYWEELGEGDLKGIISGLTNDAESSVENQQQAKALLVCIQPLISKTFNLKLMLILQRKVTVLSIMMRSTNQRSNTLQSLMGMFLQSTHTLQKVIETLE